MGKHYSSWEEIDRREIDDIFVVLSREVTKPYFSLDLVVSAWGFEFNMGGTIIRYRDFFEDPEQNPFPLEIVNAFYNIQSVEDVKRLQSAAWEKIHNGSDTSHLEVALYKLNRRGFQ